MPELPEVEVIRQRILPRVIGRSVVEVIVRNSNLRRPVSPKLAAGLPGQALSDIARRGKYMLLRFASGTVILHLGMTGFLQAVDATRVPDRHDHVELVFSHGLCLRLNDYRRFGLVIWTTDYPLRHPLLAGLGPEPLEQGFGGGYLYHRSRGRTVPIRQFIMDQRIVAGVGNIYANEALFLARLHPATPAGAVSRNRCGKLAKAVRSVLQNAIDHGATIREAIAGSDYHHHFPLQLMVYGRGGEPCRNCGTLLEAARISQRATYFCHKCQRRPSGKSQEGA